MTELEVSTSPTPFIMIHIEITQKIVIDKNANKIVFFHIICPFVPFVPEMSPIAMCILTG